MMSLQDIVSEEQDTTWVGSIRLMFNSSKYSSKSLVIVEGKSDIGLYRAAHANESIYYDSPGDGKKSVLEYVPLLRNEGIEKVYGVCDADFDHISGVSYANVYMTDFHDIEIMMLSREFIRKFFYEYTLHNIYDSLSAESMIDKLNNDIFNVCYIIGILKWINYDCKLMLNFKRMAYHQFVDVSGFDVSIDEEKYIDHVLQRTKKNIDKQLVLSKMEEYKCKDADLLHICNGHDFTYVLSLIYRGEISNDRDLNQDRVEKALRMNYRVERFHETLLFSSMKSLFCNNSELFVEGMVG